MDLEKLDLISQYEAEIDNTKKDIINDHLQEEPYRVFNLSDYEDGLSTTNIILKTLEEKRRKLIQEYGSTYERDKELYDRIHAPNNEIALLKEIIKEAPILDTLLEKKVIYIKELEEDVKYGKLALIIVISMLIGLIIRHILI